jgi:DNA (cytosine-5)-methyltransferase 1
VTTNMKTMHLFAGYGGGLLGDLILGHEPIIALEYDKHACKHLRTKSDWFPNLHVWEGDVRLFDPSEYAGVVDVINAGFPCQDISASGKQAGVEEGTRSGLYREVLRIASVVKPRFIFMENVSAILNNGLGTVLADMAKMGLDAKWCCLRASEVGANHHRDRWWLLAYANSTQLKRNKRTERSETEYTDTSGESWWEVEPKVDRVADGIPNRIHRLKGLGNAQVPLQAAVAFSLLSDGII